MTRRWLIILPILSLSGYLFDGSASASQAERPGPPAPGPRNVYEGSRFHLSRFRRDRDWRGGLGGIAAQTGSISG